MKTTRPMWRVVLLSVVASLSLSACSTGPQTTPPLSGTPALDISVALQTVGCTTNDSCAALGASVVGVGPGAVGEYLTAKGWVSLATPALATGQFSASSCWDTGCLFTGIQSTGDLVWRFDAASHAVSVVTTPQGGTGAPFVDCFAAESCALIDTSTTGVVRLSMTSDAGQSWSTPSTLAWVGLATVRGVACQSALTCVVTATSGAGVVIGHTLDGGANWSVGAAPSTWTTLSSLTCHGRTCAALVTTSAGVRLARSTDFARSWRTVALSGAPTSMACATGTYCALVGRGSSGAPWLATTSRSTVTTRSLRYVPTQLLGVACGTRRCAAVASTTLLSFLR